tara:strand:+ start:69 stop:1028 length:960 start_codon:yes stop_codon:yes gene_type:complete
MYPATYYENFMQYEPSNEVFVAMPFSETFQNAFDTVIEPAINRVLVKGIPLTAKIINRGTSGSPDIHEKIFEAIIHSRLVVADMTVQASFASDNGNVRWQANSNVAYEVGLASAWRNPEDILLINQPHEGHSYSFDVQNLRHFEYRTNDNSSVELLSSEILNAINQSSFLAKQTFLKTLQSVSPSAIHLMHQEASRAFSVIVFRDDEMPIMDARIHAMTELLSCGAIKNRHVIPQNPGMAVIYQWTELGLRMLMSLHAITLERKLELMEQIASVPDSAVPPPELRDLPPKQPNTEKEESPIDMVEAVEIDDTDDANTQQ